MYRILSLIIGLLCVAQGARADIFTKASDGIRIFANPGDTLAPPRPLTPIEAADTLVIIPSRFYDIYEPGYLSPIIFDNYHYLRPLSVRESLYPSDTASFGRAADNWLRDIVFSTAIANDARQRFIIGNPLSVPFNMANMSRAPRHLRATVDPGTNKIIMKELPIEARKPADEIGLDISEKRWLHNFKASLQFSQAYISPNWYQGGNNNVNAISQIYWNLKLNEKYYPKLLFEMTTQYKLGVNSAPDDTIRNYNISDDLFQFYAKFGYKARSSWYYSTNVAFKTQLLNNYASNSRSLRASFLSPAELNVGLGMTYSRTTKRITFGASINPLSYNLKTCINERMNETSFGIKEGHTTVSQYGSNAELTFKARITWNINYSSRLFLFTNYEYLQGDWENTLSFDINRFLSTQIYWHIRYDTSTDRTPGTDWHRFQCKEIFSFGLSYKFSTI